MDDIQNKVVKVIGTYPNCLNDRKILNAILLDYLPQNKLQQNLIINAFDEGIVEKLKQSTDMALSALQMIKLLSDNYGLTKDASTWAVQTWCYILRQNAISEALEVMNMQAPKDTSVPVLSDIQAQGTFKINLKNGMYMAGVDFPAGNIKLEAINNDDEEIRYEIRRKNSNSYLDSGLFSTQVYLTVTEGQRLQIEGEALLISI